MIFLVFALITISATGIAVAENQDTNVSVGDENAEDLKARVITRQRLDR